MTDQLQHHHVSKSSNWKYYGLIAAAVIGITILFLLGTPQEVPMGDSYIHFLYARNLILHGELSYNPGLNEGIGTSSLFWVLILAFFQLLGISPILMSKVLGTGLLILSGILIFELAQQIFQNQPEPQRGLRSIGITLITICSGSIAWLALSGMETILFLTLGLLSIWLYTRGSWWLLGITLGLMALTRIEGICLAGLLISVEFLRTRKIETKQIKILIPIVLILGPWLIYLQMREGVPITSSYNGRQFVVSAVEERIASQFPKISGFAKINPVIHVATWLYFILILVTGSETLPGPQLDLGRKFVGTDLTVPISGIVIILFCLPLVLISLKQYFNKIKPLELNDPSKRLQIILVSWILIFNLAFGLFLPQIGAAGRYIPMNHMVFWIALFGGAALIPKKQIRWAALILTVVIFGISMNYWRMVYQKNVDYLVNVRKPAALFIDTHYPANARVGATDLGAIGYYARQPVVDLLGHINQDFNEFVAKKGTIPDYLLEEHLCYLMLFDSIEGAGMDLAQEMGLNDDLRFDLVVEESFSTTLEDWSLGSGPIRNYMPIVSVYRIDWKDPSVCAEFSSD